MNAVFKAPNPSACYEVEFTSSSLLTVDSMGVEDDGRDACVRMKAVVFKGRGDVVIASIWVHDRHDNSFNGLPYWKAFHFPPYFIKQVAKLLDRGYAEAEAT